MQLHYSTASVDEVKHALAKVARIATNGAKVIDIGTARHRRKLPNLNRIAWLEIHPFDSG